jgi:hypothetical protein
VVWLYLKSINYVSAGLRRPWKSYVLAEKPELIYDRIAADE